MLRKISTLTIAALLTSPVLAQQSLYRSGVQGAVYCTIPEEARQQSGTTCKPLTSDLQFGVPTGMPEEPGVKLVTGLGKPSPGYAYIPENLPLAEVAAPPPDSCTASDVLGGGEIDRLVESADGTLRIKRFLVTQKCVKGHLKAQSRALN